MKAKDPNVRMVCSSFDFACMLANKDAIDKELYLEYWEPSLRILAKRLAPVWDEDLGEGIAVREYYKDFYLVLQEAQGR